VNVRWIVELTDDERNQLRELIRKGKPKARKVIRAQILLAADAGTSSKEIAAVLSSSTSTVFRTKRRFVECSGIDNVRAEWALVCAGHNLLKIFRAGGAVA